MKKTTQLFTALICFALGGATVHAGLSYWDSNSSASGAGTAPTGTWDTDTFWSANSGGGAATAVWTSDDTAVFSAGTDATDPFTVTVNGDVQPGGITFEEGVPTISGGSITMNAADFPIIANTNATISSALEGAGFKKTGTGTLTLSSTTSFHGGTDTIAEGVVYVPSTTALALGSTLVPTIVSNGATLSASGLAEPVILNGSGVNNSGALRNPIGSGTWTGGASLGSDARINQDGGGTWTWNAGRIVGTNGGNNFNVTFGGNGGTLRLSIFYPSVNLGTGAIYKEGTSMLQLEQPNYCSAFYFNGGSVYPRAEGQYGGFGTGNIYVGAGAGYFMALFVHVVLPYAIVLAPGANPVFLCNEGKNWTNNGVISGLGGLSKTNSGVITTGILALTRTNTYFGNTTICGGPLVLGAKGSISNSAVIDVWSGGTFDVSAVSGGFVLGAAQTLKGNGTVVGNVTANGTISPGASPGTLAFNNNLTLSAGAKLFIEVDKSASPANDVMTVTGTLNNTGTGTVTVTNLNPGLPLAVGDAFYLFKDGLNNNLAVVNGGALTVVSAGGGVVWNNQLAVNGSIVVASLAPPPVPATNLTVAVVGPSSVGLGGLGAANSAYNVYASTNVTTPMTNWWLIGTTNSSAGGVIQFLDPQATNAQRFYRFGQP